MIELKDKETGRSIGRITEEQLQFLLDQLEEEDDEDQDYWLDSDTLDLFVERGIDTALLTVLRDALGEREGVELVWVRP